MMAGFWYVSLSTNWPTALFSTHPPIPLGGSQCDNPPLGSPARTVPAWPMRARVTCTLSSPPRFPSVPRRPPRFVWVYAVRAVSNACACNKSTPARPNVSRHGPGPLLTLCTTPFSPQHCCRATPCSHPSEALHESSRATADRPGANAAMPNAPTSAERHRMDRLRLHLPLTRRRNRPLCMAFLS